MPPSAKISSPSTVGVELGPELQLFPFHWKSGRLDLEASFASGDEGLSAFGTYVHAARRAVFFVLIDECELHLHSSWQRNVLHFLRTGGGADNQFLVTTHSESLLALVAPEELVMLAPLGE